RVVERGGDSRLPLEPPHGVGAVDELQRQHLERDGAIELELLGEVDERHPTAAQQLADLILAAQIAPQGAFELRGHRREVGVGAFLERSSATRTSGGRIRNAVDAATGTVYHGLSEGEQEAASTSRMGIIHP